MTNDDNQAPDLSVAVSPILVRSYDAAWETDGRTIHGRAVPYGVVAEVADRPGGPVYRESFELGSFRRATKAPHRIELRYEHGAGLLDVVGPGVTLEERDDGLWGSWRAMETPVGDQALAMIGAEILRHLSVSFRPLGPGRREPDGTMVRTSCHLHEVSLTRTPAYVGAEVVAVRTNLAALAVDRSADLDSRLEVLRERGVLS